MLFLFKNRIHEYEISPTPWLEQLDLFIAPSFALIFNLNFLMFIDSIDLILLLYLLYLIFLLYLFIYENNLFIKENNVII